MTNPTPDYTTPDYTTCKMVDVVKRSYLMHPSLLTDAMHNAADVHRLFARQTGNKIAGRAAANMAADCVHVVALLEDDELDNASIAEMVLAFTEAAKLMLVPHACWPDIAGRGL